MVRYPPHQALTHQHHIKTRIYVNTPPHTQREERGRLFDLERITRPTGFS